MPNEIFAWQSPVNSLWYVRNRDGEALDGPFLYEESAINAVQLALEDLKGATHA